MKNQLRELLPLIEQAYDQSRIKKWCKENNHEWSWSLITGACRRNSPLIVGFNWGAAQGEIYASDKDINENLLSGEDLGSMTRIIPYFKRHLTHDDFDRASQTNYCFFRSHTEREISEYDLELCRPIFNSLIEIMRPSVALCFSSKLRHHMIKEKSIIEFEHEEVVFTHGGKQLTYAAAKGRLASGVKIAFLPHPNYPMRKAARDAAWDFCFR